MTEAAMRRVIARKRDGAELPAATWHDVVTAFLAGALDDAQVAALLMASVVRGLSFDETYALTAAFIESGETLHAPDPRTVDKHSTGGVGDSVTLIVVPLVAACGVPVAKLAGRALAHTGGTLDKLEAIPGFRTDLTPERFFACVAKAGCAIAAQSARLVPADKRIYALRDRTATVESRGLIAASIVAKKIAGGARAVAFDVKAGGGALVPDVAQARALADDLVALTRAFGLRARALVSDMDEPLGPAIGTGLEVGVARDFLRGMRRDTRLGAVCHALALDLLELAEFAGDAPAALARALEGGSAYETFERMAVAQGAAPGALESLVPHETCSEARAPCDGYVVAIGARALGERARDLVVRHGDAAGIVLARHVGDVVRRGDVLATVYGENEAEAGVSAAFTLGDEPPAPRALLSYASGTAGAVADTVAADALGTSAASACAAPGARSMLDTK